MTTAAAARRTVRRRVSTLLAVLALAPALEWAPGAGAVSGAPEAVTPFVAPRGHGVPDLVSSDIGGAAVLLRTADGEPVPGRVFLLMAAPGSPAQARVYDRTPFEQGGTAVHPESAASNTLARSVLADLGLADPAPVEFVAPPGGGSSTGLTYAVAHLNLTSGGVFTGGLDVAVTGAIRADGYVGPVSAVDEKTAAAELAGVHVLFTPSAPGADVVERYGARFEGELARARNTGAPLAEERRWDRYQAWGAEHRDGMDIIGVRHLGDVAAYLCGAGSADACDVRDALADVVVGGTAPPVGAAPSVPGDTIHRR